MFYRLKPDIFSARGILAEPSIPGDDTFMTGAPLKTAPPTPLLFRSNFDSANPPRAFEGMSIPVWSSDLVQLLRGIGIDNYCLYDAAILGEAGGRWDGYHAVNVLGRVSAAVMSKSRATLIMDSPDGTPMAVFQQLVIDPARAAGHDLFRLSESASTLVASGRVLETLRRSSPPGGWGISAFPIDEA